MLMRCLIAARPPLSALIVPATMSAVMKQVQQRARCQQQVWQHAEKMRAMLGDQEKRGDRYETEEYVP
jgi:hypothetical protein